MKISHPLLTRFASWTMLRVAQLLMRTCRFEFCNNFTPHRLKEPNSDDLEPIVLCIWHDHLLVPTIISDPRNRVRTCALISQHRDGAYLAEAMRQLGYKAVRGSSRRGGPQAVKQLLKDTAGLNIVITPDGPVGPRRVLQQGPVYLASQLGRTILPLAVAGRNVWRLQGPWTDLLIPKPFSRITIAIGNPVCVPANLDRAGLAEYVAIAQAAMDDAVRTAEQMAGLQPAEQSAETHAQPAVADQSPETKSRHAA